MRLFSSEGGVDGEELQRALTLVKRRQEAPSHVHFLQPTPSGGSEGGLAQAATELEALPALRRRLQVPPRLRPVSCALRPAPCP